MAYCVHCGKKISDEAAFCDRCGGLQPVKRKRNSSACPVCGAEVPAMSIMCTACGHEFRTEQDADDHSILSQFKNDIVSVERVITANPPKERGWGSWNLFTKLLFIAACIFTFGTVWFIYEIWKIFYLMSPVKLTPPERQKANLIANYQPQNTRKSLMESLLYVQLRVRELLNEGNSRRVSYWAQQWMYQAENLYERAGISIPGGDSAVDKAFTEIQRNVQDIERRVRQRQMISIGIRAVVLGLIIIWIATI